MTKHSFSNGLLAKDKAGTALLVPNLPSDMRVLEASDRQCCLSDGASLASTSGVGIKMKIQSIGRAIFGGNGGFFIMKTKGTGRVVVLGLGSIRESGVMPDRPVIVDNGRLVAWESALSYELTINTSLFARIVQSRITDEGVMLKFKGTGKVLVSLRNKCGFFDQILNSITEKAVKNG